MSTEIKLIFDTYEMSEFLSNRGYIIHFKHTDKKERPYGGPYDDVDTRNFEIVVTLNDQTFTLSEAFSIEFRKKMLC